MKTDFLQRLAELVDYHTRPREAEKDQRPASITYRHTKKRKKPWPRKPQA